MLDTVNITKFCFVGFLALHCTRNNSVDITTAFMHDILSKPMLVFLCDCTLCVMCDEYLLFLNQ